MTKTDQRGWSRSPCSGVCIILTGAVENGESNLDYLRERGRAMTAFSALGMLETAAVSTKHPGFCEEREWRAVSLPRMPLKRVTQTIQTIGGIPQHVQSVLLQNIPEEGLGSLAPSQLINRV